MRWYALGNEPSIAMFSKLDIKSRAQGSTRRDIDAIDVEAGLGAPALDEAAIAYRARLSTLLGGSTETAL